jgi:hypothetical protein
VWYDAEDEGCDGGDDFDADGDGFALVDPVYPPYGFILSDCDDRDPAVRPYADRVCGNGVDDDCDGTDECSRRGVFSITDLAVSVLFGGMPEGALDADGDGVREWFADDGAGAFALVPAFTEGARALDDAAGSRLPKGEAWAAGDLGGVDGDGLAVRGYWGGVSLYPDPELSVVPAASLEVFGASAGLAVADVTGDGAGDVLMSTFPPYSSARVFAGPFSGERPETGYTSELVYVAESVHGEVGTLLGVGGDLTGDGVSDVAASVSLFGAASGEWFAVFPGPIDGQSFTGDVPNIGSADDNLGGSWLLETGSDWNQDGYADLFTDAAGLPQLYFGPVDADRASSAWDAKVGGAWLNPDPTPWLAWPRPCGDINGDGFPDLALSYPYIVAEPSRVGFLYGPFEGQHADWLETDFELLPALGNLTSVVPVGDIDGDGADEVLVTNDTTGYGDIVSLLVTGAVSGGF